MFENLNILLEKSFLLTILLLIAYIALIITKKFVIKIVHKLIQRSNNKIDDFLISNKVFEQVSYLIPLIILSYGMNFFSEETAKPLIKIINFLIAFNVIFIITKVIDTFRDIYNTYEIAKQKPIKSYVQLVKLFVYIIGIIISVCILIGVSPLAIISGLGALTAVLMIVFKDTILSLVATIQIFANDLIREGDWIEVKKFGADGDVLDISLHTIKIQNFDKTIISIPTYQLLDSSFRNYRGMRESGGRRIKRSISIDIDTIKLCEQNLLDKLKEVELLKDYISNIDLKYSGSVLNANTISNLTLFREYLWRYLKLHSKIDDVNFTFLVRDLEPTSKGLPIELYIFSSDNRWVEYEKIQSQIFDHLLIALKEFELRVFQDISNK